MSPLVAYAIALLLPTFAFYVIHALDLFRTSNSRTIFLCAAWGAVVAYPLAALVNTELSALVGTSLVVALFAPFIEEIFKALILVYLIRQPSFHYFVDGAVYGFGSGIGFAVVENLAYIGTNPSPTLVIARVLSTSLMHAMTSGIVGVSLGRLRRSERRIVPLLGISVAVAAHIVYNSFVTSLTGGVLLLVAIVIGVVGAGLIVLQILYGLRAEKALFTRTLGLQSDVSAGEREAIQQLGGASLEAIMRQLGVTFGDENVALIRRLLIAEANIGILRNNLASCNVSPRLREAWETDIAALQRESQTLRRDMGRSVFAYLSSIFPTDDTTTWRYLQEQFAQTDPTMVHTFDMFMRFAELARQFTPQQLADMAERLSRIDIFRNISLADLENLSRAIEVEQYADGTLIFEKGDEGDAMYLIESGAIVISALDHARNEKYLRTFREGQVVGDFAVLDGERRSARARAQGALSVMVLRRGVFQMFVQSRPTVMLAVLAVLADRSRYTMRAVETSIQTLSAIAQGDYTCALPQPASKSAEPAHSEIPVEVHGLLERSLAQYATKLQVREQAASLITHDRA